MSTPLPTMMMSGKLSPNSDAVFPTVVIFLKPGTGKEERSGNDEKVQSLNQPLPPATEGGGESRALGGGGWGLRREGFTRLEDR